MITEFFLDIVYGVLFFVVSILPNPDSLPVQVTEAFASIGPIFGRAEYFFPVTTLLIILGLIVYMETQILTFKISAWVIRIIRGGG